MIALVPQTHLLVVWLTVALCGVLGASAALVWAVRTRQFSRQDRARYLALDETIPGVKEKLDRQEQD